MEITLRTRSQNEILYQRILNFIPEDIECIAHIGYSNFQHASTFLHDAIDRTEGILIVMDEDVFVVNWTAITSLCKFIIENKITHAGIPDGGVIHHRIHSFLNINPFFAIFNCSIIKPIKSKLSREIIDSFVFEMEMDKLRPDWINNNFTHDNDEPFAGLFYWLAKVGKPLFLHAVTMADNISTEVKGENNETLCYHCWYSRLYETDFYTKKRIDMLYDKAIREQKKW